MSPQKYLKTFDRLLPLLARKYRGRSTRIEFEKPPGRDRLVLARRPYHDSRPDQLAIDDAVQRVGLKPLGHQWTSLSRTLALQHLTFALHTDFLCHMELIPLADARQIATAFLNLVPAARCFTNGLLPAPRRKPGTSYTLPPNITTSLVDTGLVLIDDTHILLLWLEQND